MRAGSAPSSCGTPGVTPCATMDSGASASGVLSSASGVIDSDSPAIRSAVDGTSDSLLSSLSIDSAGSLTGGSSGMFTGAAASGQRASVTGSSSSRAAGSGSSSAQTTARPEPVPALGRSASIASAGVSSSRTGALASRKSSACSAAPYLASDSPGKTAKSSSLWRAGVAPASTGGAASVRGRGEKYLDSGIPPRPPLGRRLRER